MYTESEYKQTDYTQFSGTTSSSPTPSRYDGTLTFIFEVLQMTLCHSRYFLSDRIRRGLETVIRGPDAVSSS